MGTVILITVGVVIGVVGTLALLCAGLASAMPPKHGYEGYEAYHPRSLRNSLHYDPTQEPGITLEEMRKGEPR
jgi:hypothetical protein